MENGGTICLTVKESFGMKPLWRWRKCLITVTSLIWVIIGSPTKDNSLMIKKKASESFTLAMEYSLKACSVLMRYMGKGNFPTNSETFFAKAFGNTISW